MRRLVLVVLLVAVSAGVGAQKRPRFACVATEGGACTGQAVNTLSITLPTANPEYTTTEDSLTLGGIAGGEVTSLHWVNDRGGSGVAVGVQAWEVASGSGGPATTFQDALVNAGGGDLDLHVPSIGTSWTQLATGSALFLKLYAATGDVGPSGSNTTDRLIYQASPAPSTADYVWRMKLSTGRYSVSSGAETGLLFGITDVNNLCGLAIRSSTQNPDLVLYKRVAGTVTDLTSGTANAGPVNNNLVGVTVVGPAITVQYAGNTVITTSDAFCDDALGVGVGVGGNRLAGASLTSGSILDDFELIDNGGSSSGVALQSGVNVITVTAYCGEDPCSPAVTDTFRVTKTASDTTDPVVTVDQPTAGPTYPTVTATIPAPSGTVQDASGMVTMTCACPTCTPTSRTVTVTGDVVTGATWAADGTFAAASGSNPIACSAEDADMNEGSDVFDAVYTPADMTDPTVVITSNGGSGAGANFSTATPAQIISGTAADTGGSGLARVDYVCPTGTGTATGTFSWSFSITLQEGANLCTVTAFDGADNDSTPDTVTGTLTVATLTAVSTSLPPATVGTAYNVCLPATGGTTPYAWTKVSGTYPTGLSGADSGEFWCITGTPAGGTQGSYTNHVYRVTDDNAVTDDTVAMTLTVNVAGTGPHDYFNTAVARPDFYGGYSLRPLPGHTTQTDPYYTSQITTFRNGGCPGAYQFDYVYTSGDSDPHAQDGLKLTLPAFAPVGCTGNSTLQPILASTSGANEKFIFAGTLSGSYSNGRALKVESEVAVMRPCTVAEGGNNSNTRIVVGATTELCVTRGMYGTTAGAHAAPTPVTVSVNQPAGTFYLPIGGPTVGGPEPRASSSTYSAGVGNARGTVAGHTYLIVWDVYWTDSWLNLGLGNTGGKHFTFLSAGNNKFWEHKVQYSCGSLTGPNCTIGQQVGAVRVRGYNGPFAGQTNWTLTNGNTQGSHQSDSVEPQLAGFHMHPNRWTRFYNLVSAVSGDFDPITVWASDEQQEPVKLYDAVKTSIERSNPIATSGSGTVLNYIQTLNFEYGDSNDVWVRAAGGQANPYRDLVAYHRNFVVIIDPDPSEYATPGSGLLLKPLPGN